MYSKRHIHYISIFNLLKKEKNYLSLSLASSIPSHQTNMLNDKSPKLSHFPPSGERSVIQTRKLYLSLKSFRNRCCEYLSQISSHFIYSPLVLELKFEMELTYGSEEPTPKNQQMLHSPVRLEVDTVLRPRGKSLLHKLSEKETQPEAISTGNL